MRFLLKLTIFILVNLLIVATLIQIGKSSIIYADEGEELEEIESEIKKQQENLESADKKLEEIKKKADGISAKIKGFSGELGATQSQINSLQVEIAEIEKDIENLNQKMEIKNSQIETQKTIRNITLRELYINGRKGLLDLLFSTESLAKVIQNTAYYQRSINDSKSLVGQINNQIASYENDKNEITEIKTQIEGQKQQMQKLAENLKAQVNSAQTELAAVSQQKVALQEERSSIQRKLSDLSAKQKALLQEKTDTFTTSVGDVPTTGDPNSQASYDPGFRKAFALFSFGAPHRKGMSQYGSKGRAESGQDYEDILKAYYGDIEIKEVDIPDTINTDQGAMSVDGKYLKGLAEMPASWPMDALKAQAIAARTYALSYVGWRTNNTDPGGRICTTESCQVWSSSKASSSSAARWHDAVSQTKGKVMISKKTGEIFSAWYAATSGGYNYKYNSLGHDTKGGWDTKCGARDCWTSDAYESIAGSPWFYKGWYKARDGKSCGRSHPWLNEEEFADIIGALVLYEEDSDNQKHLSQPDASKCWGEDIDDTWSRDEVREKSGIEEVDDVDVSYSSGGYTAEVKVKTNKGEYKFSGEDFKAIFNLRAPGVIHLKSALFNVEVRD